MALTMSIFRTQTWPKMAKTFEIYHFGWCILLLKALRMPKPPTWMVYSQPDENLRGSRNAKTPNQIECSKTQTWMTCLPIKISHCRWRFWEDTYSEKFSQGPLVANILLKAHLGQKTPEINTLIAHSSCKMCSAGHIALPDMSLISAIALAHVHRR